MIVPAGLLSASVNRHDRFSPPAASLGPSLLIANDTGTSGRSIFPLAAESAGAQVRTVLSAPAVTSRSSFGVY